jgi:hypothetical protein
MKDSGIRRPSPSMVIALIALFVALGGTAVAVKKNKLPANSVGSKQLKPGAVGTPHVKADAITSKALAANAVDGAAIQPGAVGSDDLASGAVGEEALAPLSIGTGKLKNDAVTKEKVGEGEIDSSLIAGGAISTPKLGPRVITESKISNDIPRVAVKATANTPTQFSGTIGDYNVSTAEPVFDTEEFDNRGMHEEDGTFVTAPVHGIYRVTLTAHWGPGTNGVRITGVSKAFSCCSFQHTTVDSVVGPASPTGSTAQTVSTMIDLDAGDRIEPKLQQATNDAGQASAFVAGNPPVRMTVEWIGND